MALRPTSLTRLDQRRARMRRGRRALGAAAPIGGMALAFALGRPVVAVLLALVALFLILVAIDAALPLED